MKEPEQKQGDDTAGDFIDYDPDDDVDEQDEATPDDPYSSPATLGTDDGKSRSSIWKGGAKIAALPDECIIEYPPRERSGYVDYRMMFGVRQASVSYRGGDNKRSFLCLTHCVNDCPHTRRIRRYREEHPS
jgi:hypothetical protein